jgi:hypothetical protein
VHPRLARRRLAIVMGVVAFVIVPWTVYLAVRLPSKHVTPHWSIAWGGFDALLAAAAAFTAYALARAPAWIPIAASMTGTLLVCDAWFDLLTARAGGELLQAVLEAAVAELPLAALCFWLARSSQPSRSATRPPSTPE